MHDSPGHNSSARHPHVTWCEVWGCKHHKGMQSKHCSITDTLTVHVIERHALLCICPFTPVPGAALFTLLLRAWHTAIHSPNVTVATGYLLSNTDHWHSVNSSTSWTLPSG